MKKSNHFSIRKSHGLRPVFQKNISRRRRRRCGTPEVMGLHDKLDAFQLSAYPEPCKTHKVVFGASQLASILRQPSLQVERLAQHPANCRVVSSCRRLIATSLSSPRPNNVTLFIRAFFWKSSSILSPSLYIHACISSPTGRLMPPRTVQGLS